LFHVAKCVIIIIPCDDSRQLYYSVNNASTVYQNKSNQIESNRIKSNRLTQDAGCSGFPRATTASPTYCNHRS
jgi:hypothetical protein